MFWLHARFALDLCPQRPLVYEDARAVWARLRHAFPWAVSAVLGAREVQLLAHVAARTDAVRSLRMVLESAGVTARPSIAAVAVRADRWARVDASLLSLPRRRGWVAHPLAWGWSTARDVAGAVADPWVTPAHHQRTVRALCPLWPLSEIAAAAQQGGGDRRPLPDALARRASAAVMRLPLDIAAADARVQRLVAALSEGGVGNPPEAGAVPARWVRAARTAALHPQLCRFVGPGSRARLFASGQQQLHLPAKSGVRHHVGRPPRPGRDAAGSALLGLDVTLKPSSRP